MPSAGTSASADFPFLTGEIAVRDWVGYSPQTGHMPVKINRIPESRKPACAGFPLVLRQDCRVNGGEPESLSLPRNMAVEAVSTRIVSSIIWLSSTSIESRPVASYSQERQKLKHLPRRFCNKSQTGIWPPTGDDISQNKQGECPHGQLGNQYLKQ